MEISFTADSQKKEFELTISDNGHGMSRDTVINKWMVPSTDDKLRRSKSPSGRVMQGSKGVGRYAASILGTDLFLETVTSQGDITTVLVEWDRFEKADYLDDVEILIETSKTERAKGTTLTIHGKDNFYSEWTKKQFERLRFELKKLISPVSISQNKDKFSIKLTIKGFSDVEEISEKIEAYPIFDLYDYKIAGKINNDGTGKIIYSMQKARNAADKTIDFSTDKPTGCGELVFDIRVYDREAVDIESLIQRGLKDESGNYVGKSEAKSLLNEYNGIGVYRNGFRIRPLGDAAFDWLRLNQQRVQNPSMRIGSNQVIGYVQIQSEKQSGLIEKSARDGLKENAAYTRLKDITKSVIGKLEAERFNYRRKTALSSSAFKLERNLEKLFSFDQLKQGIRKKLTNKGIDESISEEIIAFISDSEDEQKKIAQKISQTVAIYQGQATLGKIINVILHEGRSPLHFFKNQIPNLRYWYKLLVEKNNTDNLGEIIRIIKGLEENADIFVKLFSKLDPLASGKRSAKKKFLIKKEIQETFSVFEDSLKKWKIKVTIHGPDDFLFYGWKQDIYSVFTNLIDNSIYWISIKESDQRNINININTDSENLIYIDYVDTGPGIEKSHIESEVIFEPQFSTKPEGTGLGLAIAGEAAHRNGLELKAFESDTGVYFRLQPDRED